MSVVNVYSCRSNFRYFGQVCRVRTCAAAPLSAPTVGLLGSRGQKLQEIVYWRPTPTAKHLLFHYCLKRNTLGAAGYRAFPDDVFKESATT